jgi:hypothetical protein
LFQRFWQDTCGGKICSTASVKNQKEFIAEFAQDLLETANKRLSLHNKVITGDESWVYGYDPETKAQSSQWKSSESPRAKETRQCRSNVMAFQKFYHESVIHNEYAHAGQTVTKGYYIEVLRRLTNAAGINGCSCGQVVSGSFITTMRLPIL